MLRSEFELCVYSLLMCASSAYEIIYIYIVCQFSLCVRFHQNEKKIILRRVITPTKMQIFKKLKTLSESAENIVFRIVKFENNFFSLWKNYVFFKSMRASHAFTEQKIISFFDSCLMALTGRKMKISKS